jgi:hypothetical protein
MNPSSNRSGNVSDFGVIDSNNAIIVTTRKRNDLTWNIQTMFIIYRNEKYTISSSPVNLEFEDSMIQFVAVKQSEKADNG